MLGAFVLGDENFDNDDIDINDSNEMNKDNPIYQLRLLDPNQDRKSVV